MKILITGGSGFIGRNIVEQLGGKYEIEAPTHTELELLDEDRVAAYLQKHKFAVVIHSAVRPGHRNAKDPANQLDHNCRMFFNLARNAAHFGKMIFLSSGAVYDQRYYRPKMTEDYFDVHVPADEVGFSKYIAAKYIERVTNIVELRIFGMFGRYEDYAIRFISNLICKALHGLPLTMKQDRKFDYLYINDLMPLLEYFFVNDAKYKAYNITPDSAIKLSELAELVRAIAGSDLPITAAQPGLGSEYSGDNSRLRAELPGFKETPLETAIQELYAWYSSNKSNLDRECLLFDK